MGRNKMDTGHLSYSAIKIFYSTSISILTNSFWYMTVFPSVFSISRTFPVSIFSIISGLCESINDQLLWVLSFIFKIKYFTKISLVSQVIISFQKQQLLDGCVGFTENKLLGSC